MEVYRFLGITETEKYTTAQFLDHDNQPAECFISKNRPEVKKFLEGKEEQYFTLETKDFGGKLYLGKAIPVKEQLAEKQDKPQEGKMTKEDWADKDKQQRESIEAQVSFKGIVELIVADKLAINSLKALKALCWADEHLQVDPQNFTALREQAKKKEAKE